MAHLLFSCYLATSKENVTCLLGGLVHALFRVRRQDLALLPLRPHYPFSHVPPHLPRKHPRKGKRSGRTRVSPQTAQSKGRNRH